MSSALRAQLIAGGTLPKQLVTIDVNGAPVTVEIRGLSSGMRGDFLAACTVERLNAAGESVSEVDQTKLVQQLIIQTTFDPSTGEQVFDNTDLVVVGEMSAPFCDQLFKPAQKLSGLDAAAVPSAEKNSVATTS